MTASRDYREELTAKLIEQLEAGTAPWQKPWSERTALPYNATSNKTYRGVNSLYLTSVASVRGYVDPRWATYRQAAEQGWQVRKGEKGVGIEYWKRTDSQVVRDVQGNPVRGEDGKSFTRETPLARPRVFYATVFNLRQMDGAPELSSTHRSYQWDPLERAEQILQSSGAQIIHDQADRAFYSPVADRIHLPAREQFKDTAAFYGTVLHELGHWSGHSSRLNRDLTGAFGSASYAKEELRAELFSYFLADQTGIPHDPGHHASYVKSWIAALREDKNEIFRAARDAEHITEFIVSLHRARSIELVDAHEQLQKGIETLRTVRPDAESRQPADLQPREANSAGGKAGARERDSSIHGREASATNSKAAGVEPRPARAAAFEHLPESEAIQAHPELMTIYQGQRHLETQLSARFSNDAASRDKYMAGARTKILDSLNSGRLLDVRPVAVAVERPALSASVPVRRRDVDLER